jgi:hypothetical protein
MFWNLLAKLAIAIVTLVVVAACTSPQETQGSGSTAGKLASTTAPPAARPRLPREGLNLRDRMEWRTVLGWPQSCEDAFQGSRGSEDGGLEFHKLTDGVSLVNVLCASGSYQGSFVYVRLDERQAAPEATVLGFASYQAVDDKSVEKVQATEIWGEPTVLEGTGELTILNLFRQTGDCGLWSRYAVADGSPRLEEVRARLQCPASPGRRAELEAGQPPSGWKPIRE